VFALGLVSAFEPSCATAHHLGSELPKVKLQFLSNKLFQKFGVRVLYPTSNLADSTLEDTLTSRGFLVTRLNAYDTNSPIWNKDQLEQAKKVDIVAFFSPSAATSWAEKVGNDFIAVTFGPSTTAAAQKLNFREVRSCKTIELESLVDMLEECYHRAI
jgi:uroporphyrinogen-III synthase